MLDIASIEMMRVEMVDELKRSLLFDIGGKMEPKQELFLRLKKIISEHLAVEQEEVTEESTWFQLGADSLDRLEMSLAIEEAFKVDIPHTVGERLNSVGQTVEHLSAVIAERRAIGNFQIEAATAREQTE